ncbi:MAG TPA: phytanoyl-CoA dioxygenase family protein [Pseudomonadales bacterium]|nr:phytanoyl-CoA dioxygenase family protein [Pseudomonadales bacterium]
MATSANIPSVVGWDAATPPNETVDEWGDPSPSNPGFGVPDPRAPRHRAYDDPDVVRLREHLRAHNGIFGLEIVAPDDAKRAARIFLRDGFVVVCDVLSAEQIERFRAGCDRVLGQILATAGKNGRRYMTETQRLPHRYSYGTSSASRHLMHEPEWTAMIDLPTTTPILTEIFGGTDYYVRGGGGDVCLPGAIEYQHLHWDFREPLALPPSRLLQAERLGVELRKRAGSDALDLATEKLVVERTPPLVTINFLLDDQTWENGPIRQIPGTQALQSVPPVPLDEPEWMRLSTLVGVKAGSVVFRDTRAWHGGTPNLSRDVRAMPNIEYVAPWFDTFQFMRSMPHDRWAELSPHGQRICRFIKCEPGEWPRGAGVMHPLASARKAALERAGGPKSEMRGDSDY